MSESLFLPLFSDRVTRNPEASALADGRTGERLTYADLDRRSGRLASYLRRRGVGTETRVGLRLARSVDQIVTAVAVLKAGGTYVPLDPAYPAERLELMRRDAALAFEIDASWLADHGSTIAGEGVAELDEVPAGAAAYVIYTSGSTGRPKGVVIEHRALGWYCRACIGHYELTPEDRLLQMASISFDISVGEIFPLLAAGASLELHDARDGSATEVLRRCRESAITVLFPATALWHELVTALDGDPALLPPSLRLVSFGGEKVLPERIRAWQRLADGRVRLCNGYGPTEATVEATLHDLTAAAAMSTNGADATIGRPVDSVRAYVLDPDLRPVPDGERGELCVASEGLARGYFGRPAETALSFVPAPEPRFPGERLYRTGDLVRRRRDGNLEILGRLDRQVKIRGFRVELGEVETTLAEHPEVDDVAVIAREDDPGRRRLAAYVVSTNGVGATELRCWLRRRLPDYLVPSSWELRDELPLTPNRKIDRAALARAPAPAERPVDGDVVAPRTAVEETLAEIWSAVLRLGKVGVHDNYFELGGDSILAIQIATAARRRGLGLAPRDLFRHPTIAELAERPEIEIAGTGVRAEQGRVTGPVPLTPVQHWFLEEARLPDRDHFNQSLLLAVREDLDRDVLERAVEALVDHHDALRLRIRTPPSPQAGVSDPPRPRPGARKTETASSTEGAWYQVHDDSGEVQGGPFVVRIDLSRLADGELPDALDRAATEIQASLDLEHGPLLRLGLFATGDRPGRHRHDRLLLAVHHLVVDAVTWRVLVRDLETVYRALRGGGEPALPAKTTSYREWARRLVDHARSAEARRELDFWLARPRHAGRLPIDFPDQIENNTMASHEQVTVTLDAEATADLLRRAPRAYHTRINDLLLTALALSLPRWTEDSAVLVDLEGHGREPIFPDVDLSRTAGWFTATYPVALDLAAVDDPGAAIRRVKETLRAIPRRGLGHGLLYYLGEDADVRRDLRALPRAEMTFNYLGQLDSLLTSSELFHPCDDPRGSERSLRGWRSYLIEVDGGVKDDELHIHWHFSRNLHRRRTIERVARDFMDTLRGLVAHCVEPGIGSYTPSDFPLAGLSQERLDLLMAGAGAPVEIEDVYPLTPMQAGMLFHSVYSTDGKAVYFEQSSWALDGRLEVDAFRAAWQRISERHAILRTGFVWHGMERPLQVVHRRAEVPCPMRDLRDLSEEEQRARLEEILAEDRRRGFVPERPPLLRLLLIRLADEAWRFVWSAHHVLLDGWSIGGIFEELFDFYREAVSGELVEHPRPVPFRDYLAWLDHQDRDAAESFWRRELEGFGAPTPLLSGGPETGARNVDNGDVGRRLSRASTALLSAFTRRHGLTLNTLVQGAWALVLARTSGEDEVVFGVTVSGRPASLPGAETIIGLLINTLPVRVRIDPSAEVTSWLARLQDHNLEIRNHEHAALVDIHSWSDVPHGRSLFESLIVFENYPVEKALESEQDRGQLRIRDFRGFSETNYPLTLGVLPGDELQLLASYDRRRCTDAAVRRLLSYLATALGTIAEGRPKVRDLSVLSAAQRHQVLVEWNVSDRISWKPTFWELFEQRARDQPDVVAVIDPATNRRLTYRELRDRATTSAADLRRRGVGPEVRVGLLMDRSIEMIVATLAVLAAGGAYVPLDPSYPQERLRAMMEDAGLTLVLTDPGAAPSVLPSHPRPDRPGASPEPLPRPGSPGAVPGAGIQTRAGNTAYIIYTSGSTGRPKGVVISNGALAWYSVACAGHYRLEPGQRVLQFSSISFDIGVGEIFPTLAGGATLVLRTEECLTSIRTFLDRCNEWRINVLLPPTAFWHELAETVAREPERVPDSLRLVSFGGEQVLPERVAGWRRALGDRVRLYNGYGPTEATVEASIQELTGPRASRRPVPTAIGRPVAQVRNYVLDRELSPVPMGAVGELCIESPGLARGYLDRPADTATAFVPHPFSEAPGARLYRTGDLVRHLDDGGLEIVGRADHQVKIRGFRVEPGEVEAVLAEHPAVSEAAVLVRQSEPGERRLVAWVTAGASSEALLAFLRDRLPAYLVPSDVIVVPSMPRTPAGKIDRAALAREDLPRALRAPATAPDRSRPEQGDLERTLTEIWREVLARDDVGVDDSFFELGGHSLLMFRLQSRLEDRLGSELPLVNLFQFPTIRDLARSLRGGGSEARAGRPRAGKTPAVRAAIPEEGRAGDEIAIVGMAGRFPGALTIEGFRSNLRKGVESISTFTDDELLASGVPAEVFRDPDYVRANGVLEDAEGFDAAFFGYNPAEARSMDPQHRQFLEVAWEALESAGCDPRRFAGAIGVYAGSAQSDYEFRQLIGKHQASDAFQIAVGNGPSFLSTLVSYKLDLRGPGLNLHTACSTSLVAVHVACRALLAGECDLALAGGVGIQVPQKVGYLHDGGSLWSVDGHVRAFDAAACGTLGGNGLGVVVLRRLDAARAAGDPVRAVIRGTAINNDGSSKVGFTAPSVTGQAEVIRAAHSRAGVEPATIAYVETHGTATPLGDPVEIAGLTQAFGPGRQGSCAIGSLKTNLGHLDSAAGVAGLIKAALSVENAELYPSLHFERPNPQIGFAETPFYVNTEYRPWPAGSTPRRAGVSSFGIGGTNAHVVVEEAPAPGPPAPLSPSHRPGDRGAPTVGPRLLVMSAKTSAALDAVTANLARHLEEHPEQELADVAWTLQTGRAELEHRRFAVCRDRGHAVDLLRSGDPQDGPSQVARAGHRSVVFLFPGGGAQYPGMGLDLYRSRPGYRRIVDDGAEILRDVLGFDLRELLFPTAGRLEEARERLPQTSIAFPALFLTEVGLARHWMEWGVEPEAMIGHSLGEYVAACLSGVLGFEDALRLVTRRGQLLEAVPGGEMVGLPLSEDEVRDLVDERMGIAAVNGPESCVVSGSEDAVAELVERLAGRGVDTRRIPIRIASHSPWVEPVLDDLVAAVRETALHEPHIPYVSNVSGDWISAAEATDPEYYGRHLRRTVRFGAGLRRLLEGEGRVLLEVGPGRTLATLARQLPEAKGVPVLTSLPHHDETSTPRTSLAYPAPDRPGEGGTGLLGTLGRLWLAGVTIDWGAVHGGQRRKVLLPTYPWEHRPYLIDHAPISSLGGEDPATGKRPDLADWFLLPAWRRSLLPASPKEPQPPIPSPDRPRTRPGEGEPQEQEGVLVLSSGAEIAEEIVRRLAEGGRVVRIELDEMDPGAWSSLIRDLDPRPRKIVHLGGLDDPGTTLDRRVFDRCQARGLRALLHLARALEGARAEAEIVVVSTGLQEVTQEDKICPEKATLLAAVRVIPQECPSLTCRSVDVVVPETAREVEGLAGRVAAEIRRPATDPSVVAWRGGQRWVRGFDPVRIDDAEPVTLRRRGVYLITGGRGEVGLALARFLARRAGARLVLLGRSTPGPRQLAAVRRLEADGAEVLTLAADVADPSALRRAVDEAEGRFGAIHGVIHAAGLTDGAHFNSVHADPFADLEAHFRPKVLGLFALDEVFAGHELDFCLLTSSLASFLGGLGFTGYTAANLFMDAFARRQRRRGLPWVSVNWDSWRLGDEGTPAGYGARQAALAMTEDEGAAVFARLLSLELPAQIVVSTGDLDARLRQWTGRRLEETAAPPCAGETEHDRPDLTTPYVAPRSDTEATAAEIWAELLGVDRIGIHDGFFELGGHSLLATRILSRLRRRCGVVVPLHRFFQATTVARLAAVVDDLRANEPVVPEDEDLEFEEGRL